MYGKFVKGMLIGGLIGASLSMAMNPDLMRGRTGKRIMRSGRQFLRKSGNLVEDVIDLFR